MLLSRFAIYAYNLAPVDHTAASGTGESCPRDCRLASMSHLSPARLHTWESPFEAALVTTLVYQLANSIMTSSSISLVPWDPDSPDHVERLRQQRKACGWKVEKVPDWQKIQRDGKLAFYWIVRPRVNSFGATRAVSTKSIHRHLLLNMQKEPTSSSSTGPSSQSNRSLSKTAVRSSWVLNTQPILRPSTPLGISVSTDVWKTMLTIVS